MSKCEIIGMTAEARFNSLNKGVSIMDLGNNPTRDTVLESFAYLEEQFASDMIQRKEFIDADGESILRYAWDLGGKEFVFHKSPSMLSRDQYIRQGGSTTTDSFGELTLDIGTTVHYAFERLMEKRAGIITTSKQDILDDINGNSEMANLTPAVMSKVESRVNEVYVLAEAHQKKIDPTQQLVTKVEVPLHNPKKSLMGTQDLLFVFSDRTAWDFDYKTSILTSDKLDGDGNPKFVIENFAKRMSHGVQMIAYKEAKIDYHGITAVTKSEIIPLGLKIKGINKRSDGAGKSINDLTIDTMFSEDEINGKTSRSASIASGSHIESLTVEMEKVQELLSGLQTKRNKSKKDYDKMERYNESIKQFEQLVQNLLVHGNMETIYKTMAGVLLNIPSNINEPLTIEVNGKMVANPKATSNSELLIIEKQLDQLRSLERVLADMMQDLHGIKASDVINKRAKEVVIKIAQFEDDLRTKGIITTSADPFKILEERYNEVKSLRLNRTIERIGADKMVDGKITAKALNFWETWLTVHGEIDHPGMRALGKLNNTAHIRANRKFNLRSDAFIKVAETAANYANTIGSGQEGMMDMVVDKETGNMVNKHSEEFTERRDKAFKDKDIAWIREHHELTDFDGFVTEHTKARHAKLLNVQKANGYTKENGYPSSIIENDAKRQMDEWEKAENLVGEPSAWLSRSVVLKNTTIKNADTYLTDRYNEIASHAPILEFYNEFSNLWAEMRQVLDLRHSKLPDNFIPNIQAELIDNLKITDLRGTGKEVWEQIKDSVTVNEVDRVGMTNAKNGEHYEVPVLFVQPLNKDSGRAITLKSYDVISSAISFMKMAYTHAELVQSMPDAEMILKFMENPDFTQEVETTGSGRSKVNEFGNKALVELGIKDSEVYAKAKAMFDNNWLGVRYTKADKWPLFGGAFDPTTGEESGQISLAKAALTARSLNILSALGFNMISAAGANMGGVARAMVIGRENLAYTRDQFIGSMKGLADPAERDKMMLATLWFNTSAEGVDRLKIWRSKSLKKGLDLKGAKRKWLSSEGLMKFFSGGDALLSNVITSAMLKNFGYDNDSGKVRLMQYLPEGSESLWDKMEISEDGAVTFKDTTEDGFLTEDQAETIYSSVRMTMKSVTGQLNEQELMGLQETILGTLFTTFRTWLPSILQSEYGKVKYVEQFEALREGRARTLYSNYFTVPELDKGIKGTLKTTLTGFLKLSRDVTATALFLKKVQDEGMVNSDQAQLQYAVWAQNNKVAASQLGDTHEARVEKWLDMKRRNMASGLAMLRTIARLMALSSLMLLVDLDDDDKADVLEYPVARELFRVFNRATGELATPYSPGEILKIGDTSIPAVSVLHNALQGVYNGLEEGNNIMFSIDDPLDKTPLMYYTSRNIPLGSILYKVLYRASYTNPPRTQDQTVAWRRALGL